MEGNLVPGRILRGKYEVIKILGSGGMGIVVLARHLRLDQHVAIKMLRTSSSDDQSTTTTTIVAERFAREARAASKLRGAHAVRILDVDDSESGDPFLVMEYLAGSDLQHLIAEQGPLAIEAAIAYMLQTCEGVAEAHAAGIVHRDLKPANLFLTTKPDGSPLVKLLDFGISKMASLATTTLSAEAASITRPDDAAIGSPAYMSPEQIKSSANVDLRTDIWALGVVLFHFLSGALPFEATTTAALAARIASDPPLSVKDRRADAPDALVAIVARCLAKDPADRFRNVGELASALAAVKPELGHAESAARIARVIATTGNLRVVAVATEPTETSAAAAAASAETPPKTAPTPIATASVRDVAPAPRLEDQLIATEYASTRQPPTEQNSASRPKPGARIIGIIGALSVTVVLAIVLLTRRGAPPPSPSSVAVAPAATPSSSSSTPAPSASPSPSSSASVIANAAPLPPIKKPLPARRTTPTTSTTPTSKNPMDLDFR